MSTDYDCWKEDEAHVTLEMVLGNLSKNAETAKRLLSELIDLIGNGEDTSLVGSTKFSIVTAVEKRNPAQVQKLKYLFPTYF